MKFRIYSYDVWGNKRDGYQVNNVFKTMYTFTVHNDTDKAIINGMKRSGFLAKGLHTSSFYIDGDSDYSLYVEYIPDGHYPIAELRRES